MKKKLILSLITASALATSASASLPFTPTFYGSFVVTDHNFKSVTDAEGHVYDEIRVGDQIWLDRNMYTSEYPDGRDIKSYNKDATDTSSHAETGKDTNKESAEGDEANKIWGHFHQWGAAMNGSTEEEAQGICPSGYHIPTHQEFIDLFHYIDSKVSTSTTDTGYTGTNDKTGAGAKTKDQDTAGDDDVISSKEDSAGTNFPLAGFRDLNGDFKHRSDFLDFWTSTKSGSDKAWRWNMSPDRGDVYREDDTGFKLAFSVRCIKD